MSYLSHRGFTLTELLITVAIFFVLMFAAIPIYGSLQISTQLNEHSAGIVQALRSARERASAGVNNSAHGVYFNINPSGADKYVLYQGSSYIARSSTYDQEKKLEEAFYFGNSGFVLTGTDIDVNFSKTLGVPLNTGTLIINNSITGQRKIIVNSLGTIIEH